MAYQGEPMPDEPTDSGIRFTDRGIDPTPETPKRGRGRPKGSTNTGAPRGRRSSVEPIKAGLGTLLGGLGTVLYAFPQTRQDGVIIANNCGPLIDSLGELAKQDVRVRRVLGRLVTGSAWGSVALAASAIVLPVLANHNLLPAHINMLFSTDESGMTEADKMAAAMSVLDTDDESIPTEEGPSVALG